MIGAAAAAAVGGAAFAPPATPPDDQEPDLGLTLRERFAAYFQEHDSEVSPAEVRAAIARLEKRYRAKYGVEVTVDDAPPIPGVIFGYALNISKCKGYRYCVRDCVEENNHSREAEIQYIRVLEMDRGTMDLEKGATTTTMTWSLNRGSSTSRSSAISAITQPASTPARSRRPGWSPMASW